MGSFWPTYIMFELKKYRGVIFHDTEEWCKIWRKTDLWFGKWHEEFGRSSPEHLKVSKLGLWWDPFIQSRKCICLKFTGKLCFRLIKMTKNLKTNLLVVKNWHEEFEKFWPEHSKIAKTFSLMGSVLPKYIMFELKRYRVLMFDETEDWCKISRKTDLCFHNWHEKFANFHRLKNSDFILEIKMAELNKNKN